MMFRWIALVMVLAATEWQAGRPVQQAPVLPDYDPVVLRNQKQFNFLPGGKLLVTIEAAGSCRIVGWQRSAIRVESEQIAYNVAPGPARALLEQYPLSVRWTQTEATMRATGPPNTIASLETNLVVYVPGERTDVKASLAKGDFSIGAVSGWIEANLVEGSIEARPSGGYFSGVTRRGEIRAELAGKRWLGHSFTAATKKGSVDLVLPVEYSAALQLETKEGELTIDFPAQLVDGEEVPLAVVRNKKGSSLSATVGSGGTPVRLRTDAGSVRLSAARVP